MCTTLAQSCLNPKMMENGEILVGVIVFLVIIFILAKSNTKLRFQKRSHIVKTGKWIEDYFPFLEDFPVPPETFKFLGEPIDGVAFVIEKGIFFIEFKTGSSQLSDKQKEIKKLVEDKKVYWKEIRIR